MNNNVIYFPYTHVPEKNQWFNQVVLYWDDIYSINPAGKSFEPYMQEMIDYELVKPINLPDDVDTSIKDDDFLKYIDKSEYPVDTNLIDWDNSIKLFHEKFDKNKTIAKALIDKGYAVKEGLDYNVESYTANLYMLFLANEIGKYKDYNATPITDTLSNLSYSDPSSFGERMINPDHYTILKDIFPAPYGSEVDAKSIYDFKKNNHELCINFREYVEGYINKIANTKDPERKNEIELSFKIESECIKKEISEKMEDNKWKNVIRNKLCMFGLHGALTASLFATGAVDHSLLAHSILLAGESIETIYHKVKTDRKLRQNPLAYAVVTN